ncbi:WG repeat-containing protein [Achromobacter sp.]|uniref:WG repeat-containing protein n=1 Tax=Achromobacter sp. TaxID=134375 RepID=UPI0028A87DF0|nr:WG repeat-containing protein [Achromobacter sp.]
MGNRAWLYLCSDQDQGEPPAELASANGNLPTLWQVLLAQGEQGAALDVQDIFGEGGTAGIAVEARAAHDRLCELAAFMRSHAAHDDAPHVLQFDAATQYLGELIDEHDGEGDLWISANLNELSWLHAGGAAAYVHQVRALCDERWRAVRQGMQVGDLAAVCPLLDVQDAGDASGWAWRFGFGGLSHAYFHEQEPARTVSFEDYVAEDDDDAWLGGGLYRYRVDKLWGLRAVDPESESDDDCWLPVMAPQWDAIWSSGATDEGVLWISREGRTGLLGVTENVARVLVAPRFDAVWQFEEDVASVQVGDKVGLIAADGREILPPSLDEAWNCAQGLVVARVGDLLGFVDKSGGWAITPRFEDAGAFCPGGLAPAFEAQAWGLIDRTGGWVAAPEWEDVYWDEDLHAFITERDGKQGLIDASGRPVLDACFAALAPLDTAADAAELWKSGLMRISVLTQDERRGVVDGQGAVWVPIVYSDLGEVSWLPSELPGIPEPAPEGQAGRYARILANAGRDDDGDETWAEGVYDMAEGREVLACRHVLTFGLAWDGGYGWLALQTAEAPCPHNVDGLYVGVARAGGDWLHEPVYAWIGSPESLQTAAGVYNGPPAIAGQWSQGDPVRAMRGDTGALVMLHRDGRVTPA